MYEVGGGADLIPMQSIVSYLPANGLFSTKRSDFRVKLILDYHSLQAL